MDIIRIEDFQEIYENDEISELLGTAMFNPTPGKIQSLADRKSVV